MKKKRSEPKKLRAEFSRNLKKGIHAKTNDSDRTSRIVATSAMNVLSTAVTTTKKNARKRCGKMNEEKNSKKKIARRCHAENEPKFFICKH